MGLVKLEGMEFFAYHGYYDEEQAMGNKYNVDLSIYLDLNQPAQSDKLSDTINYEELYRMIRLEMEEPARLLEHIAFRISRKLLEAFQLVQEIEISISKFNPPLGGICKSATIVYRKKRADL
ncbi:MAG: dihydroneopterin aldolase [Flammeovirgaceae bacterium]